MRPGVTNRHRCHPFAGVLALAGTLAACAAGSPTPPNDAPAPVAPARSDAKTRAPYSDAYYLSTCAQCAGTLGARGEAVDVVIDGRDLRFCSPMCERHFRQEAPASVDRLDRVMIADQRPHYGLTTSIASGLPLPQQPFEFIRGNRLFRVLDAAERDRVLADPARFIPALDLALISAQRPTYGMPAKCPVQGDILSGDVPIDFVVASRMVRVCCKRCERVVRARPYQYLAMVDYANAHPAP